MYVYVWLCVPDEGGPAGTSIQAAQVTVDGCFLELLHIIQFFFSHVGTLRHKKLHQVEELLHRLQEGAHTKNRENLTVFILFLMIIKFRLVKMACAAAEIWVRPPMIDWAIGAPTLEEHWFFNDKTAATEYKNRETHPRVLAGMWSQVLEGPLDILV